MPRSLSCPSCRIVLKFPDKASDRKVNCPNCGSLILVQAAESRRSPNESSRRTSVIEPLIEDSRTDDELKMTPKLIPCPACDNPISVTSQSCPKCGAKNTWIHPEIQRFIEHRNDFDHTPEFRFVHEPLMLRGSAEVKRGANSLGNNGTKAFVIGLLCFILGVFAPPALAGLMWVVGPIGILTGLVLWCVATLQETKDTDYVLTFCIDFNHSQPRWKSDDDDYWQEIKSFFNIRQSS